MGFDGARHLAWSVVVRREIITRLVRAQRNLGYEAARARREKFDRIVFGDLAHIS